MFRNVCNFLLVLMFLLAVSGCGDKLYDLRRTQLSTAYEGNGTIVIATQDRREFVVSGEVRKTYLGRHFLGNGLPKRAYSRSGMSVADDISSILGTALANNGFRIERVTVSPTEDLNLAHEGIRSVAYDRAFLISMNSFRAESFQEVEFKWDFEMVVYDNQSNVLAELQNTGFEEGLIGNYLGAISAGQAQKAIGDKVAAILYEMLCHSDVKKAIESIPVKEIPQEAIAASDKRNTATVDEDLIILQNLLKEGDLLVFRDKAKQVYRKGIKRQEDLDVMARIIWSERDSLNGQTVDGLCFLCKSFMRSGQPRYKSFFDEVGSKARSRKLRKYAIKTSRLMPEGVSAQFEIVEY